MGKHRPTIATGEAAAALIARLAPLPDADTDVFAAVSDRPSRVLTSTWVASTLVAGAVAAGVAVAPQASFDPPLSPATRVAELIPDRHAVSEAIAADRLAELAASRASRASEQAAASQVQAAAEETAHASQEAAEEAARQEEAASASQAVTEAASTAAAPTESVPSAGFPGTAAGVAVDTALAQIGKPYVWAAEGPSSFDCSGLVLYAYAAAGIDLPRVSSDQARAGVAVSREDLQPGDLVAFYSPVSHIGIYIGDGQIVHAPEPGDVVKVTDIDAFGSGSITALRRVS